MSVLLRIDGRDCDLVCHRAVPGTPCDCICRGAYHAVGSTDAARRKLIADQGLADLDDEQLATLFAGSWPDPYTDEDEIRPELVARAREIVRSRSEQGRVLLVAGLARDLWQAEAFLKTTTPGGAQPMLPGLR